jgi:hypothetical protein
MFTLAPSLLQMLARLALRTFHTALMLRLRLSPQFVRRLLSRLRRSVPLRGIASVASDCWSPATCQALRSFMVPNVYRP